MRAAGADHVLVSGSGPTVVGLFGGGDGPGRATEAASGCGWPRAVAAEPVDEAWRRCAPDAALPARRRASGSRSSSPSASASSAARTLVLGAGRGRARALGVGVVEPPNLTDADRGRREKLGQWTYLLVGALAFLETGAFIGLIAPGETAVLIGGVVAGQGQISIR